MHHEEKKDGDSKRYNKTKISKVKVKWADIMKEYGKHIAFWNVFLASLEGYIPPKHLSLKCK